MYYPNICILTGYPFFDNSTGVALFPAGTNLAIVPIRVFPEEVRGSDLQFTVRLVVPPAAMAHGVVLGEPNVANVTVPGAYYNVLCMYICIVMCSV